MEGKSKVTGMWLPGEVAFNKNLSETAKILWWRIESLDDFVSHCYASNAYLADKCGISESSVSKSIAELKKLGYIEEVSFDGRKRTIKIDDSYRKKYKHLIDFYNAHQEFGVRLPESSYADSENSTRQSSKELLAYDKENMSNSNEDCFLKKTSSVFDKTRQVDLEDVNPTVAENKEIAQTKNKPLVKDSVAIAPENMNKVAPRPTPRKVDILKKETKPTPKTTPQEVQELIQFWCGLGLVQHRNPEKKVYQEASRMLQKLMKAKFFEKDSNYPKYANYKFTKQEIMNTFEEFKLAALNFNYQPQAGSYKTKLAKTSLPNFLYDNHNQKSLFIQFFEEKAILLKDSQKLVEDLDPEMTNIIKYVWVKDFLNGVWPKDNIFTPKSENDFRKCTRELSQWYDRNKTRIPIHFNLNGNNTFAKRNRVDLLFTSIKKSLGENSDQLCKVGTGWLCSEETISRRLPVYLGQQGVTDLK